MIQKVRAVGDDTSEQALFFLQAVTEALTKAVQDGSAIEYELRAEDRPLPPVQRDGRWCEQGTIEGTPRTFFLKVIPKQ